MFRLSRLAEKGFVVLTLFLSTTALIGVLLDQEDAAVSQDPYTPIIFTGIYMVTFVLILQRWKSVVRVAQKDIWIWLLLGIVVASVFWTVAPEITPRRSILLLGTTLFGIYLAVRYTLREQLQLLAWVCGIIIILSFVFAIALPSYGLMTFQEGGAHAGAWRGILPHKNILGRMMNLSAMVFLLIAISNSVFSRKYHWVAWAGFVLSVALIILSTSKTALVVCLTLTVILPLYRALRSNYTQLVPLMIAAVLVGGSTATLLVDNLPVIANALGKDLTLTGRTDIWAAMLDLISERPLFGYGFNGVWQGWDNEVTAYLWRTLQWECPYGHNGFIDLLAELGILGLIVFSVGYVTACIRGVMWLRMTKTVEGLFPLMYLTFLFIYNITESSLVITNSIFWILYISMTFSTAVEYEQAKRYSYVMAMVDEE